MVILFTQNMIALTIFKSIFDNKTNKRLDFNSFDDFESFLYRLSKEQKMDKKSAELISPAIYKKNTTRKNDNVTNWAGWAAVDVDDFQFNGDNLKNELIHRFPNYRFVCYSTASSTVDFPKFRLIFPLRRYVNSENIKRFWYALQTELGDLGDRQTKDLSRMYYIPATYDNANNFIFSFAGNSDIDPDILIKKHPMPERSNQNNFFDRLPKEMQKEIIEHRKGQLTANYEWTSYSDCPFWPKTLAAEYQTINNTGWYHKMYQIMVAIAGNAISKKYPITANEISQLCRQFDIDTGNWYKNRPMDKEADRALEYVYKNG